MKILITAFEPFGGDSINPALEAVNMMRAPEGVELIKLKVPTVFQKSINTVYERLKSEKPDAVLCVGQAGGRFGLTPERVAVNIDDASIPDNEGNQPVDKPIFEDGPAAYFATLPIKAMIKAIREGGLPSSLSNSAGTFVCNHLMYGVLYHIAHEFPGLRGGFIHVPFIPEQVVERSNTPSMAICDITRGLELAVKAIAEYTEDIHPEGESDTK